MIAASQSAQAIPAPLVRLRAAAASESEAVRGEISRIAPARAYLVKVIAKTPAVGCVSSASVRIAPPASGRRVRFALAPRGIWCTGLLVVRIRAARRGAPSATVRLSVRAPAALGQGNVVGHLLLGPTCPVERVDDPCDPVAHPAPVALLALDDAGVEAARATTLSDGSFALDLRPGSYRLHADAPAGSLPRIADTVVRVEASATRDHPIRTTVLGDTGIR